MTSSDAFSRLLYQARLAGTLVLWHSTLALLLLPYLPWPVPPVLLLGWPVPSQQLGWALLGLAAVLLPDYDDRPAVRVALLGLTLLLGTLL